MNGHLTNGHASPAQKGPLKVIISGGGIAGLTLANALELAGISYVLLEGKKTMAPQVGASIGIIPNGSRILDQLGLYDNLKALAPSLDGDTIWVGDGEKNGRMQGQRKLTAIQGRDLIIARTGYEVIFVERQIVLQHLFDNLKDKSAVLPGNQVASVDHSEKGVVVKCVNGNVFRGDIIVGADGVHSKVREEMRRYADLENPALMAKDRKSLSAEYACIFGIASPVPGIEPGAIHRCYHKNCSTLTIGSFESVFFFAFKKLDKRYFAPNIPRFTATDEKEYADYFINKNFLVGNDVRFADIWERRTSSTLVATEEAQNDHWTWGRFVCVGDSIHKVTPNAGAGGNASIESAAALANSLYQLANESSYEKGQKVDFHTIQKVLQRYHDSRKVRAAAVVTSSNSFTRLEAFKTPLDEIFARYALPRSGEYILNDVAQTVVGATKIDFLPPPKRSLGVTMPFNLNHGVGKEDSLWWRILMALPLVALFFAAKSVMGSLLETATPFLGQALQTGMIGDVPVRQVYSGFKGFDEFIKLYVVAFTPSLAGLDHKAPTMLPAGQQVNIYAPQRLQMTSFLSELTPVTAIWLIESCRRGNAMTFATIPIVFLLYMQMIGIGRVAPAFYFLHYISIQAFRYHAADNRLVRMSYAKTLIPALILGYIVPTVTMYWPANTLSLSTLQLWNAIWQLFPIWTVLLHGIFARCVKDTTNTDRSFNVKADLPYLRAAYLFSIIFSTSAYAYANIFSSVSWFQLFISGVTDYAKPVSSLAEAIEVFLKVDQLFSAASGAIWILLCFSDLKRDGRLSAGWPKILISLLGSMLVLGPGAGMAVMWWWREEALARR